MLASILIVAALSMPLQQSDVARIDGDQLIIEPIGVTLTIPPVWVGRPDTSSTRMSHCSARVSAAGNTVTADKLQLERLASPADNFTMQFAQVVDSVMPLQLLLAHLSPVPWIPEHGCVGPHIRVYTTGESADAVHSRVMRKPDIRVTSGRIGREPTIVAAADSAGWRISTVSWTYAISDAVGAAEVLFLTRVVRERTLLVVLMNVGTTARGPLFETVRSMRIRP